MGIWKKILAIVSILAVIGASTAFSAQKINAVPPPVDPNMSFQIMRASVPACEPDCPEWIFASGKIVAETAVQFNQTLHMIGKAPVLIIINSGGGDVRAALNMGRAIRARKMNVAVGRAYTYPCEISDPYCTKDLKPKTIGRGWISSGASYCASACTLVLASGVQRIATANSLIGTHQIITQPRFERVYYREKYLMKHGYKRCNW